MSPRESKPAGCLVAILRLFGIRLATDQVSDEPSNGAGSSTALPYGLRDDFLSPAEFSFYRVLELAVANDAVVCPKVNLNDVFFVTQPKKNQSYRNKIDRKHVDFILCDPISMRPCLGIELDDSSHRRSDRQNRDIFVDEVFRTAKLPLLRFAVQADYQPNTIAETLKPYLGRTSPKRPPKLVKENPATAAGNPPLCPKCELPMVRRAASKGPNKGKPFWGCQNYPKCRQMIG